MSIKQWLSVGALALMPLAASAQQKPDPNPLDPFTPTSVVPYQSAFSAFRSLKDDGPSPDKVWRTANEEMRRLGGHVGHMKGAPETVTSPDAATSTPKQGGMAEHTKHH